MDSIKFEINKRTVIRISFCIYFLLNSIVLASSTKDSIYYNVQFQRVGKKSEAIAFILADSLVDQGLCRLYYIDDNALYGEFNTTKRGFNGSYIHYHQNGIISQTGNLKHYRYIGQQEFFDVNGQFQRGEIYHFKKGIIGQFYFSASGKKIYSIADRLGTFGKKRNEIKALNELGIFVNANLEKPAIANDYSDPKVLVSFLIAPDGSLEEIKVSEGLHPVLDAAAIKVISIMPPWNPAVFKRQNVYSEFSISIRF